MRWVACCNSDVNVTAQKYPLLNNATGRYVNVEGSELRLGVYESSSTLCVYLESDALGATLEHNLWVKFRVALLSGKGSGAPDWKQSAICTKTWNNSVLQFPKVSRT